MRDDQPLAQGGELLANWVISCERLSHWQFVAKLDSEVDPQSGLRSGTVDVGSETEAGADEVEALVGQDAETYLKGMNGEVYLISLERVVGRWTRRFPPGTIIGQGSDARHLRGGRQLEALFVRSYVWHERPPEIVLTTNGWHRIGPHDKRAPGETETPHSQTIEGLSDLDTFHTPTRAHAREVLNLWNWLDQQPPAERRELGRTMEHESPPRYGASTTPSRARGLSICQQG